MCTLTACTPNYNAHMDLRAAYRDLSDAERGRLAVAARQTMGREAWKRARESRGDPVVLGRHEGARRAAREAGQSVAQAAALKATRGATHKAAQDAAEGTARRSVQREEYTQMRPESRALLEAQLQAIAGDDMWREAVARCLPSDRGETAGLDVVLALKSTPQGARGGEGRDRAKRAKQHLYAAMRERRERAQGARDRTFAEMRGAFESMGEGDQRRVTKELKFQIGEEPWYAARERCTQAGVDPAAFNIIRELRQRAARLRDDRDVQARWRGAVQAMTRQLAPAVRDKRTRPADDDPGTDERGRKSRRSSPH